MKHIHYTFHRRQHRNLAIPNKPASLLLVCLCLTLLLAACNRGSAQSPPPTIRAPKPTFTPAVNDAAAAQAQVAGDAITNQVQPQAEVATNAGGASDQSAIASAPVAAAPAPTGAKVIVTDPLVNARGGPGINYDVITIVERGEEFDILARSDDGQWWQVCCTAEGDTVWLINDLVDTDGPVDAVGAANVGEVAAPAFAPGKVRASINIPLLNARREPNTNGEVIAIVEAGQEYDVLAANDARHWYQVCCVDGQEAWLTAEYIDISGGAGLVPIFGQAPAPAAQTGGVATAPTVDLSFDLTSIEQFAESGGVRIFLFVTDDGSTALEGYTARIMKDGREQAVSEVSFGGQPGFTWPFQDARQRGQNWKAEFPNVVPTGVWEVELVNSDGVIVGPKGSFTLATSEPNQELYLRYERQ